MAIITTEEIERIIRDKVASGQYATEEEVVSAAFQSLKAQDGEIAAIEEGIADIRAGRTQLFDEVQAELRAEFPFVQSE